MDRCPECGQPFDPDDPSTYQQYRQGPQLRLTPPLLGWLAVAFYIIVFVVLESLGSGVKNTFWLVCQPILIVAGVILAVIVVVWGWCNAKKGTRFVVMWPCCVSASILLFLVLAILLPSFLFLLEDAAAVQAEFLRQSSVTP